jgi:hypothetical protein
VNWEKMAKNVGRVVELQPAACFLDSGGRPLPWTSDDWRVDKVGDERTELINTRTQHRAILAKDHIHHFTSDPNRSLDGSNYGFLVLQVQLFVQGDRISIRPCSRPGDPVLPPPGVEVLDSWVDIDFPSAIGIQQRLEREGFRLSWTNDSRLHSLLATGWERVIEPDAEGRLRCFRLRTSPENQTLVKRLL